MLALACVFAGVLCAVLVGAAWMVDRERERCAATVRAVLRMAARDQESLLNRIQDPVGEIVRSHEVRDREDGIALPRFRGESSEPTLGELEREDVAARIDEELAARGELA